MRGKKCRLEAQLREHLFLGGGSERSSPRGTSGDTQLCHCKSLQFTNGSESDKPEFYGALCFLFGRQHKEATDTFG